jgi:Na+/melibiose symporter-like transporter
MQAAASVTTVAHVIQLAVAPVFLLTGVGAILAVLINRLARVVDRFRVLERMLPTTGDDERAILDTEMAILSRRARLIHWAISLCTVCALFICIVIATLFTGSILGADLSGTVAALFIAAMLALISGLLCFLREITLATGGIHVVPRKAG